MSMLKIRCFFANFVDREVHLPPETCSIMLLAKMIALVKQVRRST